MVLERPEPRSEEKPLGQPRGSRPAHSLVSLLPLAKMDTAPVPFFSAGLTVTADFGQTPLGWTIYGSINGWHAERGDYAAVLELLLDAGATPPPLTSEVKATEPVLAVLRRRT